MLRRMLLMGICLVTLMLSACGQDIGKQLASGKNRIVPGDSTVASATEQIAEGITESTGMTEPVLSPSPQPNASETSKPTPTVAPESTAPSTPIPSDGIVVKSDNILSSSEKEALLAELEKELDNLFGAINEAPEDQELLDAEEALSE